MRSRHAFDQVISAQETTPVQTHHHEHALTSLASCDVSREGQWSVLERDPDPRTPADPPPAAQPPAPFGEHPSPLPHPQQPPFGHMRPGQRYHNNAGAYSSMDYELEELKARLERLLPDA